MNPTYAAALARLEKKAQAHIFGLATELQADWIDEASKPGTGRVYGKHQASAPGEPLAVDTGLYRQAIQTAQLGPLTYGVGIVATPYPDGSATTAEVAVWGEFGTRTAAPRPTARTALDQFKARKGL